LSNAEALIKRGEKLFTDKTALDSLHQQLADNFYPERGMFTTDLNIGDDFASHLQTSYPILVRRDLGNAFGSMLRQNEWFHTTVYDDEKLSRTARSWLEMATRRQRKAMYDRLSGFVRATKEGDHDFATFGQCVIQPDWDWDEQRLLYLTWHLKDCAWSEAYNGSIGEFYRRWKPTASQVARRFPKDKLHANMLEKANKSPHERVNCLCVAIPAVDYDANKKWRKKWMHVVIDVDNKCCMEEINRDRMGYVIPRWQTVSGSQYAYSPAAIAGLPDARLIQAMTLTLLEAGEMAVRPPLVATKDAIREDVQWYPGGITWADVDYDQRTGKVLEPIAQDKHGLPFGMEFAQDVRQMLMSAFYLNKITLPFSGGKERTAYEAGQVVQQYIREAVPLFEPMETEYNGALCDDTFEILQGVGLFGSFQDMPRELSRREVRFEFEGPLHEAIKRKKGITFLEVKQLLMEAAQIDKATIATLDVRKSLRDALDGVGAPADWLNDEDVVTEYADQLKAAEQAAQMAEQVQGGATAAEQLGKASQALQAA
jgi:hypothetical protein